jgi:NADH-quinone oxidoreductase subunit K
MPLLLPTLLAAMLFSIGIYGVLARRNAILVLMAVELMLNAVNLNLITFDVWLRDQLLAGQVFTLFVITIAAAEIGLGLAIILLVFRNRATASLDELDDLRENDDPRPGASRGSGSGSSGGGEVAEVVTQ